MHLSYCAMAGVALSVIPNRYGNKSVAREPKKAAEDPNVPVVPATNDPTSAAEAEHGEPNYSSLSQTTTQASNRKCKAKYTFMLPVVKKSILPVANPKLRSGEILLDLKSDTLNIEFPPNADICVRVRQTRQDLTLVCSNGKWVVRDETQCSHCAKIIQGSRSPKDFTKACENQGCRVHNKQCVTIFRKTLHTVAEYHNTKALTNLWHKDLSGLVNVETARSLFYELVNPTWIEEKDQHFEQYFQGCTRPNDLHDKLNQFAKRMEIARFCRCSNPDVTYKQTTDDANKNRPMDVLGWRGAIVGRTHFCEVDDRCVTNTYIWNDLQSFMRQTGSGRAAALLHKTKGKPTGIFFTEELRKTLANVCEAKNPSSEKDKSDCGMLDLQQCHQADNKCQPFEVSKKKCDMVSRSGISFPQPDVYCNGDNDCQNCVTCNVDEGFAWSTEQNKCSCDPSRGFVQDTKGDKCVCDSENGFISITSSACELEASFTFDTLSRRSQSSRQNGLYGKITYSVKIEQAVSRHLLVEQFDKVIEPVKQGKTEAVAQAMATLMEKELELMFGKEWKSRAQVTDAPNPAAANEDNKEGSYNDVLMQDTDSATSPRTVSNPSGDQLILQVTKDGFTGFTMQWSQTSSS